jgi:DNA-directed RNA polymerase subunit H (RpoH/RPB5)
MLPFSTYVNSWEMMSTRGFEDADSMLEELDKDNSFSFMGAENYRNIGFDFSKIRTADIKDIDSRFAMSYTVSDAFKEETQFVIFGSNAKGFVSVLTSIILEAGSLASTKTGNLQPNLVFNIITSKDFSAALKARLDIIASKVKLIFFLDQDLVKSPFHAFGSKYELLTEEEAVDIAKSIMISKKDMKTKMRRIYSTDPIIKFYGFYSGQVIRIRRTPIANGSLVKETLDYLYVL